MELRPFELTPDELAAQQKLYALKTDDELAAANGVAMEILGSELQSAMKLLGKWAEERDGEDSAVQFARAANGIIAGYQEFGAAQQEIARRFRERLTS